MRGKANPCKDSLSLVRPPPQLAYDTIKTLEHQTTYRNLNVRDSEDEATTRWVATSRAARSSTTGRS